MNILTNLYSSGADAYKNLFLVKFTLDQALSSKIQLAFNIDATKIDDYIKSLSIRCSSFEPPTVEQGEYEVRFMNHKINRPNAKIKIDRKFSLKFRVDDCYNVYKILNYIQELNFNGSLGTVVTDIANMSTSSKDTFDVVVSTINKDLTSAVSTDTTAETTLFKFEKCWIDSLTPSEFSSKDSNPVEVTATIRFINYSDVNNITTSNSNQPAPTSGSGSGS